MGSQPMFSYNFGHALMSISLNPKAVKRGYHFDFLNVKIQIIFANEKTTFHMQDFFFGVCCKF